ncbi:MAG: hypothetical protein AAF135_19375 [Bacteroidota bacterium]
MKRRTFIRFFLGSLIFFCIGEVLIRLDEHFGFFQENKVVKIAEDLTVSPILEAVERGDYPIRSDEFRIMVIGDSYINGGGIPKDLAFARRLEEILPENGEGCFNKISILDVSRPNNNMLDNYLAFEEYQERFPPHLLILGYNFNDVQGMLKVPEEVLEILEAEEFNATEVNVSPIRKIYDLVYTSRLLRFVMKQFNIRLKAEGIFLPGSEFYRIIQRYQSNQEAYQQVQQLIDPMVSKLSESNGHLLFYYMPEINLIEHADVFDHSVIAPVRAWTSPYPGQATFINGFDAFEGKKSRQYTLSKYDGHANPSGHDRLASFVIPTVVARMGESCP